MKDLVKRKGRSDMSITIILYNIGSTIGNDKRDEVLII